MSPAAAVGAGDAARLPPIALRRLGLADYDATLDAMRRFTDARDDTTPDELWLVQHAPVYTVGIAGRPEHFPESSVIPVKRIDRGGQITYHGPGQAVVYTLIDLARRGLKVRELVHRIEQAVIDLLAAYNVFADRRSGAPGVYVGTAKVAALGLRVRRGCSYHGVALNVDMDLAPFLSIDPCGYPGLAVTQTSALGIKADTDTLGEGLARAIIEILDKGNPEHVRR